MGVSAETSASGSPRVTPSPRLRASMSRPRARDLGLTLGLVSPGPLNAITDIAGIRVGHTTLVEGEGELVPGVGPIRTGCTAIISHDGDIFRDKLTAAVIRLNGFGEVTNSESVHEMGTIEGPILLTNTHNVPRVADAVIDWMFDRYPEMGVSGWGVSPIVAETHDGLLNDIRGRHVHREHVYHAIDSAQGGEVEEGAVGGGTGMICYGFKGGIGTSSRRLAESGGGYTVGVLVQSNFGWRPQLRIDGAPVGRELEHYAEPMDRVTDGSIIVVMATDAPMTHRQLTRLGMRAAHGIARTGTFGGNTSGDFTIAFSTARRRRVPSNAHTYSLEQVVEDGELINLLFQGAAEATEEAILNSLFKATTMRGRDDRLVPALPIRETVEILRKYGHPEAHEP